MTLWFIVKILFEKKKTLLKYFDESKIHEEEGDSDGSCDDDYDEDKNAHINYRNIADENNDGHFLWAYLW